MVLRRTKPDLERGFRVPVVLDLRADRLLLCLYLMIDLPATTWERFVVWLLLGLVIYFVYGRKHSRLRQGEVGQPGGAVRRGARRTEARDVDPSASGRGSTFCRPRGAMSGESTGRRRGSRLRRRRQRRVQRARGAGDRCAGRADVDARIGPSTSRGANSPSAATSRRSRAGAPDREPSMSDAVRRGAFDVEPAGRPVREPTSRRRPRCPAEVGSGRRAARSPLPDGDDERVAAARAPPRPAARGRGSSRASV